MKWGYVCIYLHMYVQHNYMYLFALCNDIHNPCVCIYIYTLIIAITPHILLDLYIYIVEHHSLLLFHIHRKLL